MWFATHTINRILISPFHPACQAPLLIKKWERNSLVQKKMINCMYHIYWMRKEKNNWKDKKPELFQCMLNSMYYLLHNVYMVTFAKGPMISIICPVFILGLIFYSSSFIPSETIAVMFPSQELPVKGVSHQWLGDHCILQFQKVFKSPWWGKSSDRYQLVTHPMRVTKLYILRNTIPFLRLHG